MGRAACRLLSSSGAARAKSARHATTVHGEEPIMGHKKTRHGAGPVPPANQSHIGPGTPGGANVANEKPDDKSANTAGFHEQDAQRRLGNYEGAGEHSYVQP